MDTIRIIFLVVSCLALAVSLTNATERQVQLTGELKDSNIVCRAAGSLSSFLNATVVNKTLDLAFYDSADNLTVEVWDCNGVCVYDVTTFVFSGVHLIANLSVSKAKAFDVYIYNEKTGTFIMGSFQLP